ncbi:uncharacterized protein LOC115634614 [Scaptodrosophila lebanonensis]|uniref:Uncharacterized protein LOC115634614 n=1 Tax=Drosophila lebanonensis TaxID=7225 RepID=A0A6J2ULM5_DROLE|nr:uncharacterized protein LOC115634614 [Scaptodrosophila lebanonensis]
MKLSCCFPFCGKNEVWVSCGDTCPPSCNKGTCITARCYGHCNCLGGYIREHKYHGACVVPSECARHAILVKRPQVRGKVTSRPSRRMVVITKKPPQDNTYMDSAQLDEILQHIKLPDWLVQGAAALQELLQHVIAADGQAVEEAPPDGMHITIGQK